MHVTSLFVTHDQEEAFAVADRVILVNRGRIEQIGSPAEILETPSTEFVARFVGDVNVLEGRIDRGRARVGAVDVEANGLPEGASVRLVIRCYDLKFWRDDDGRATVRRIIPLGDRVRVEAAMDGDGEIFAQFPRRSSLLKGIEVGVRIAIEVTLARVYPASNPLAVAFRPSTSPRRRA
jgi:sulfate transport system ATP-binding protein